MRRVENLTEERKLRIVQETGARENVSILELLVRHPLLVVPLTLVFLRALSPETQFTPSIPSSEVLGEQSLITTGETSALPPPVEEKNERSLPRDRRGAEALSLAKKVVEEQRLNFLVKEVVVEKMDRVAGWGKMGFEPEANVRFYPEGAVIGVDIMFHPPEVRRYNLLHELGHTVDPDANPYLDRFLPPRSYYDLHETTARLKETYWRYYFIQGRVVSPTEVREGWKVSNAVGKRFWPRLLDSLSETDLDKSKTFVLSAENLKKNPPAGSVFAQAVAVVGEQREKTAQEPNFASQNFTQEDLGRGLMFLFFQRPELFESPPFEDADRKYLGKAVRHLSGESFAEVFALFSTLKPSETRQKFPDLFRLHLDLQVTLAVARTQYGVRNPEPPPMISPDNF